MLGAILGTSLCNVFFHLALRYSSCLYYAFYAFFLMLFQMLHHRFFRSADGTVPMLATAQQSIHGRSGGSILSLAS
jgi:hypothetical protein